MAPADEYQRRLNDRQAQSARYEKIHVRLGYARLALAIIAGILAWGSFSRHALSSLWITLPIVLFAFVASYHSRVLKAQEFVNRAVSFYKSGLRRIEDRWAGSGQTGERFNDQHHEYAGDLDLFVEGGLFELLSTARTRIGEEALARWLLSPSSIDEIQQRHAAIRELRNELDFREALAVLGKDAQVGLHPEALIKWAEAASQMNPRWVRWLALVFAILATAAAVVWAFQGLLSPLVLILVFEAVMMYFFRRPIDFALSGSEHAFDDLRLLRGILARIESHRFTSPYLQSLQSELRSGPVTGSDAMARLSTIVNWAESRRNLIVRVLDVPLMYSIQVAFSAEKWRTLYGSAVKSWLRVVGEIEAQISIATYSYEHPDDIFPQIEHGGAFLLATGIGHPLIPQAVCVRNDVNLGEGELVLLISGSNMSGKSTLLRAVGVNVVLAMAGAPVRATSFRLSPLRVGASIRINDSLQNGSSRFYAEITRLRRLFDLASSGPVLFLLDELLQGTNSRDRLIGAEGVVSAFLERGCIGLVTTHDLALTEISERIGGGLRNFHFQEEFKDGKLYFDYKLREGVVTSSNGLALMRSIGLKV